jgi:hypothetical protein
MSRYPHSVEAGPLARRDLVLQADRTSNSKASANGGMFMKRAMVLLLLVSIYAITTAITAAITVSAVEHPERKITTDQARALVMASLSAEQRLLPKLGAEQYAAPDSSKFVFFTVTWEGTPNGSVVVGNYAVDPYTGDVFSAVIGCREEKNKRLRALQDQIRATLHLSQPEYQRLKTKGPQCGDP